MASVMKSKLHPTPPNHDTVNFSARPPSLAPFRPPSTTTAARAALSPSPARPAHCPMLRYLNSVARKAGMDFFPHVFAAAPLLAGSPFTDTPAHGSGLLPLLEEILRRPNNAHPWGINEY